MFDLCRFLSWFRQDGFFTEGSVIESYFFFKKWGFEVKNALMMYLFHTNMQLFTSQDINWWTGVVWITCGLLWCFYQLFGLSFWRHPFTTEDPLVSKWWNATFLQIWWRNKLIYILDGLRISTFSAIFIFGWTIPWMKSVSNSTCHLKCNTHLCIYIYKLLKTNWQILNNMGMHELIKCIYAYFECTVICLDKSTCQMHECKYL